MSKSDLTLIDHFLSYDDETGEIRWRYRPARRIRRGCIAGSIDLRGNRYLIGLRGRSYRAEYIAWFLGHGEWPEGVVYHLNGNWSDNRRDNLAVR